MVIDDVKHGEARRFDVAPHTALRVHVLVWLALLAGSARSADGQTQSSLGVGMGNVRYPGGARVSSMSVSPTITFDSPNAALSAASTFATLPLGVWSGQGRADVWMATPSAHGGFRLGLQLTGAGTALTDGSWSAAAHGIGEVLWVRQRWGIALGAGPSAGWIVNTASVTALHTRARAWWQVGALSYGVSVEPTRFFGMWFTDASATVTASRHALVTSLWGTARVSSVYGSKAAGGFLLRVFPVSRVALELGAGSYLADPYQGLPRGAYVTAGLRVFMSHRAPALVTEPPLIPERHGDSIVVRFRMERARSVAIAGDWDGWQVRNLSSAGEDNWERALVLPAGTYHFNLLVDGREWVVPGGVAIDTDSNGGMVGVLVVP